MLFTWKKIDVKKKNKKIKNKRGKHLEKKGEHDRVLSTRTCVYNPILHRQVCFISKDLVAV